MEKENNTLTTKPAEIVALGSLEQKTMMNFAEGKALIVKKSAVIMGLKINSQDQYKEMEGHQKELRALQKRVEERQKEVLTPFKDTVSRINTFVKDLLAPSETAMNHARAEYLSWNKKLEAEREKEMKRIREEEAQKKREADAALAREREAAEMAAEFLPETERETQEASLAVKESIAHQVIEEQTKSATKVVSSMKVSGMRKVWTFDLEDISKVPREYLVLDTTKVNGAIKNEVREIPGLKIYQKDIVAMR